MLRASVKDRGVEVVVDGSEVGPVLKVERGVAVESCGGLSWRGGRSSCGSWVIIEQSAGCVTD